MKDHTAGTWREADGFENGESHTSYKQVITSKAQLGWTTRAGDNVTMLG